MIASDLSKNWYERKSGKQKRDRPLEYNDITIERCLKIRALFNLRLVILLIIDLKSQLYWSMWKPENSLEILVIMGKIFINY